MVSESWICSPLSNSLCFYHKAGHLCILHTLACTYHRRIYLHILYIKQRHRCGIKKYICSICITMQVRKTSYNNVFIARKLRYKFVSANTFFYKYFVWTKIKWWTWREKCFKTSFLCLRKYIVHWSQYILFMCNW